MGENKKLAKTGFPSRGKTRKQQKTDFPREGKPKISGRYFPKIGKTRKCGKSDFPNLGRIKNLKGCISQPLEEQKILLGAFPTPWTSDFFYFSFIQPLGRVIFFVFHSSNPLDERFFPFFIHPSPQTSISMRGFPPIRLLFGVVNSRVSCRVTNRNAAELTDLIRVCRILGIPRTIRVCIYRI